MTTVINGTTGITTADITATSYQGSQLAGFRNKIINGNFDIWQRGTTAVTTAGSYQADRWLHSYTGDTFSATQGTFASGDTLYDSGGATYYTQIAVTSSAGASNLAIFEQRMEDVRVLAGQTVTVSFWAKAASGTPQIGLEMAQVFGSGGSTFTGGTGQAITLSTTWTKYTKTFSVPNINGKTVGTSSYTGCVFWLDAGSSFNSRSGSIGQSSKTVSIAQVQVEIGSVATPFEQRPIGVETDLCKRYARDICTSSLFGVIGNGVATSTTNCVIAVPIGEMRTTPAIENSLTASQFELEGSPARTTLSTIALNGSATGNQKVQYIACTVASGLTAGWCYTLRNNNNATNKIILTSEL